MLLKKIHWVINSPVVSGLPLTVCGILPTWGLHEDKKAETVPWTEQQERQQTNAKLLTILKSRLIYECLEKI